MTFDFQTQCSAGCHTLTFNTTETSIKFFEQITVGAHQSAASVGWLEVIEDMQLPFTATIGVTGVNTDDEASTFFDDNMLSARKIALLMPYVKSSKVIDGYKWSIQLEIDGFIRASWVIASHTNTTTRQCCFLDDPKFREILGNAFTDY